MERGPHRGWTWYYFEVDGRAYKMLTQCAAEKGYRVAGEEMHDQSTIYADDGQRDTREPPWPSYHNVSVHCMLTIDAAIKIVRETFVAYHYGIAEGEKRAQRDIKKSLGL